MLVSRGTRFIYLIGSIVSILLSGYIFFYSNQASQSLAQSFQDESKSVEKFVGSANLSQAGSLMAFSVLVNDPSSFQSGLENYEKSISQIPSDLVSKEVSDAISKLRQDWKNRNALAEFANSHLKMNRQILERALTEAKVGQMAFTRSLEGQQHLNQVLRVSMLGVSALLFVLSILQILQLRAELKAQKSEMLNQILLDSLAEAVFMTDQGGLITKVNQSAIRMLKIGKSQIEGRRLDQVFREVKKKDGEQFQTKEHPLLVLARSTRPYLRLIFQTQFAGESRYFSTNSQPLSTLNGNATASVISITEVTDLIQSELELEASRAQVVQKNKLSSLGEMAAGIAHEINNPLGVIQLAADSILESVEENEIEAESLRKTSEQIAGTVGRISKIIQGLRSFAREGSQDAIQNENLMKIVEETLQLCQSRLKHSNIKTSLHIDEKMNVACRATQLSQVLLNLVVNAADAIAGLPEKWIKIEAKELNEQVQIEIIDSGSGISEEVVTKLFQPFFTTKAIGKGTGLGLSLSKNMIEAQGGTLEYVKSAVHTTFRITLSKNAN